MRNWKKFLSAAMVTAMTVGMLAGCGGGNSGSDSNSNSSERNSGSESSSDAGSGDAVLKIGGIGPTTGGAAIYGEAVKNGAELAVKEINADGGINGWLSELAFVPVDFNVGAMQDEWSGDFGVGCKYFSQDAVIKLAEAGGYRFKEGLTPAQKLKEIQALVENNDPLAKQIYEDIGIYLAYTLPYYAKFYDMKHVLLLGRVMGGKGGNIVLDTCKKTIAAEYPAFADLDISLPDESNRRLGQSIAAASLPADRD